MRVLLAEDEKRMVAAIGPYKTGGVSSLYAERNCAPVLYVIYHILFWIKVLYTDVFLDKTSFLFMQVDRCLTKYAKIAYLWVNVQFYKYSKIAYFSLYLGLLGFRIIMRKQGVEQLVDISLTLGGFFLG